MSVKMEGTYLGHTRVKLVHESGAEIVTCAPMDNGGDGTLFSPTDLAAAATGACILTIMAFVAEREKIPFEGTRFTLEKDMQSPPRRIGRLSIDLHLPGGLTEAQKKKLEAAAEGCPVKRSLDPSIEHRIAYHWGA
jgi:putative redox protein